MNTLPTAAAIVDYSVQVLHYLGDSAGDKWIGHMFPLPDKCWTTDTALAFETRDRLIQLYGPDKVKVVVRKRRGK